ncbi:MAG: sigma-70 family RNA polymerase sigma factor [Clostridiales bacterium]|nr:sigma-70 family RNA polymerase sigma factor [Clostridiales bacterium]
MTMTGDSWHEGLAVACARRFLGRGVPLEELLQEARAAALLAKSRFDPSRGLRFSTYAVPVILGALREHCRRAAPMHIPRAEMRLWQRAIRAQEEWTARQGTEPGLEPLSRALQVDESRLRQVLACGERMQRITADPELSLLAREDGFEERVLLMDAVRRLGRPYAAVLWLRYVCGFSQVQVGQRLGASQSQACRWEKMALGMLRRTLMDE